MVCTLLHDTLKLSNIYAKTFININYHMQEKLKVKEYKQRKSYMGKTRYKSYLT